MTHINFHDKSLTAKIVYYGPEGGGKTECLRFVHERAPGTEARAFTEITADECRFEFLSVALGEVDGLRTTLQLYTTPGAAEAVEARRGVLRGADVVIFVADARGERLEASREAFERLGEDLRELGMPPATPVVFQWNHSDALTAVEGGVLEEALNPGGRPAFASSPVEGGGVLPALKRSAQLALDEASRRFRRPTQRTPVGREQPALSAKVLPPRSESSRLRAVRARAAELSHAAPKVDRFEVIGVSEAEVAAPKRGLTRLLFRR
jgi:signal recognition particle receptor subunit beta